MSISKVSGFKVCDMCYFVIQDTRYYQFQDKHYHVQKPCVNDLVKHGMELKTVKSHVFPEKEKGKK